jgi:hypothetical protein
MAWAPLRSRRVQAALRWPLPSTTTRLPASTFAPRIRRVRALQAEARRAAILEPDLEVAFVRNAAFAGQDRNLARERLELGLSRPGAARRALTGTRRSSTRRTASRSSWLSHRVSRSFARGLAHPPTFPGRFREKYPFSRSAFLLTRSCGQNAAKLTRSDPCERGASRRVRLHYTGSDPRLA